MVDTIQVNFQLAERSISRNHQVFNADLTIVYIFQLKL